MQIEKIKIDSYHISDLAHQIEQGILHIPRFQRDYVWERTKVVKLLDSIYHEYPIGSFFLWDAPQKYNFFYRNIPELKIPEPDSYSNLKFILDGQQRIVSLYVAIKGLKVDGTDYSKIYFDLEEKTFYIPPRGAPKDERYVQFCKMFDDSENLDIYDNLPQEHKRAFGECKERFTKYPLSIIYVRDAELDDVVEMFERVNRGGKPLSLFDLVVAGTWTNEFDLKEKVNEVNEFFKNKGFGGIRVDSFTQALALILKSNCTNSSQLQMKTSEIEKIWEKLVDSFKLAVDFLTENLGVKIYDFIPYPAILSLIAYLFFQSNNKALDAKQADDVKHWFWRAAFSERYASATLTRMGDDKKNVFDVIAEKATPSADYPVNVTVASLKKIVMHRKSAVKNAVLCILALQQPRHLKNNNVIVLDKSVCADANNSERHHIFPQAYLKDKHKGKEPNLLANYCMIPAELNKEIRDKKPSDYMEYYKEENPEFNDVLKSHLLPDSKGLWDNYYDLFIEERANLMHEMIERYIGGKISQSLGNESTKVIDKLEKRLRFFIDNRLQEAAGENYWKQKIPGDIIAVAKERLTEAKKKNPDMDISQLRSLDRLGYCDIMHYSNIVLKNWDLFEDVFQSRGEVEKRFANLKSYRNSLMHFREMDNITKKEGEAAVEWLSKIIV